MGFVYLDLINHFNYIVKMFISVCLKQYYKSLIYQIKLLIYLKI